MDSSDSCSPSAAAIYGTTLQMPVFPSVSGENRHPIRRLWKYSQGLAAIPLRYVIETSGIGWPDPSAPDVQRSYFKADQFEWIISLDALDRGVCMSPSEGKGYDEAVRFRPQDG